MAATLHPLNSNAFRECAAIARFDERPVLTDPTSMEEGFPYPSARGYPSW